MLESNGQISDYGGQPYGGKTLLEPVNVIIVDPTSTSTAQATRKLNATVFWVGFPAQPIHSTGFRGEIDDVTYHQQPRGLLRGYSDNLFIFPNDHGRIFGPDAVDHGDQRGVRLDWRAQHGTTWPLQRAAHAHVRTSRPTWPGLHWPCGSFSVAGRRMAAWSPWTIRITQRPQPQATMTAMPSSSY